MRPLLAVRGTRPRGWRSWLVVVRIRGNGPDETVVVLGRVDQALAITRYQTSTFAVELDLVGSEISALVFLLERPLFTVVQCHDRPFVIIPTPQAAFDARTDREARDREHLVQCYTGSPPIVEEALERD